MDFDLGPDAARLRPRLRDLVEEHLPPGFLGAFTADPDDLEVTQQFAKLLAAEKLLTLAWPREFGGRESSVWEQTVLREEMWAHHEPRGAHYMGLNWVGPAIMRFGSPEQQRLHLPRIAAGDVIWCQGFSEPEAGSDLAALRTTARRDDEGWVLSGRKVWTSYAQIADWCFLAARTGPAGSRRDGVSIFLVPMDRDGIEVRPIASMLGPHHLNEVFFDRVRVHRHELLGDEHAGWDVIRESLAFERVGIARYARADFLLQSVLQRLDGFSGLPVPLRGRYARALVHNRVARLLAYDVVAAQDDGRSVDGEAAAARIAAVVGDQEASDVLVEAIGPAVLDSGAGADEHLHAEVEDYWRYSRAATIAAGALDILRGLVAKTVLRPAR